jgi:hypothetical protein
MTSSHRTRENASSRSRLSSSAERESRNAFLLSSLTLLRGDRNSGIYKNWYIQWHAFWASLLELLMQINLRQGVHPQYLESGCNFEHYLGFRVDCNKHNLWPAWVDPKNVVEAMSSWLLTTSCWNPASTLMAVGSGASAVVRLPVLTGV